ncbi:MAG: fatty acid desaturase [Stagnimonas sp.]|nr:fatty acid desaturase [Stagnimonas sp.]
MSNIYFQKVVATMTDEEKINHVRTNMQLAGDSLRSRHPWLRHQDAIGASIMTLSVIGMIASAVLFYVGWIPWWVCTPAIALFASFVHELEHDLIHFMYFRKTPRINSAMLLIGWLVRPSTLNPLVRRRLHMHHHKHSGTETDLEERGITNGVPWGISRLLMTGDNLLSVYMRPWTTLRITADFVRSQKASSPAEYRAIGREVRMGYFPIAVIYYTAWHGWIAFHLVDVVAAAIGHPLQISSSVQGIVRALDFAAVVLMLPSFLRTFCLHFISSNMHYYGDVEDENPLQQCQVLNAWWTLPFQLFCFNFGGTHAIHHFLVKEPFYVRQWTAPTAHKVLREVGVRFNDVGTFRRANRYAI